MEINQYPFVWVEQTVLTYLLNYQEKEDFKSVLKDVPNVIYSSDLGQTTQMDVDQWLNQSAQWFDEFGINKERKDKICLHNPMNLLML